MDLTVNKIEENKAEFIELLRSTGREGVEDLIDWLCNKSDFFWAPSSTIYHCNYAGGLCQHSLNVYYAAKKFLEVYKELCLPEKGADKISEDSVKICALLHDLCKTNYYVQTEKWKKGDNNEWIKYFSYTIDDKFPMGHGEKSVFMITRFMQLTGTELLSVRWHMGAGGDPTAWLSNYQKPAMQKSFSTYPLCTLISQADYFASYCMEEEVDQIVVNRIM